MMDQRSRSAGVWCALACLALWVSAGCVASRPGVSQGRQPGEPIKPPAPKPCTLTVGLVSLPVAGAGRITPGEGRHPGHVGDKVQVSATPDNDSIFAGWECSGLVRLLESKESAANTAVLEGDATVSAKFVPKPCTLTLRIAKLPMPGTGRTSPEVGEHKHYIGKRVPIAAVPDAGSAFAGWEVKGRAELDKGGDSAANTLVLKGDATLYAKFTQGPIVEGVCSTCGGRGRVPCMACAGQGKVTRRVACSACGGAGKAKRLRVWTVECGKCRGIGQVDEQTPCADCRKGLVACPTCKGAGGGE